MELVQQRYSCRTYQAQMLENETRQKLEKFLAGLYPGPLGSITRFALIAASESDRKALKSLGTYGFIKAAPGFIVGACKPGKFNLEDYGYQLELSVLFATELGLGTCWLGGTFTKSSFARKIAVKEDELVPAVASVGYIAEKPRMIESFLGKGKGNRKRLPWENLFFDRGFFHPLSPESAGNFLDTLYMVRLSPSASNRQPWRLVKDHRAWHFYLQRTPGYRESPLVRWTTIADLQRIDLGIAMCHFELGSHASGCEGSWEHNDPMIELPDSLTEYIVSWSY